MTIMIIIKKLIYISKIHINYILLSNNNNLKMPVHYNTMSFDEIYNYLHTLGVKEFLEEYYILQKLERFQWFGIQETNKLADLFVLKISEQRNSSINSLP